jgi:hypothetical protein
MRDLFTKPLEAITWSDVESLRGWPESLTVEFKEALSAENGETDTWPTHGNLGKTAKTKLFKELVAFANTSGGQLVLGISERRAAGSPPLADEIKPLPRCANLAERFEQAAQAIDPPIPLLRVWPVIRDETSGEGILLFRVPQSRASPHRSIDKEVYVRRETRSVPVSMRDIQDMTLARGRRDRRIDEQFVLSAQRFGRWFEESPNDWSQWAGFQICALPIGGELEVGRLYGKPSPPRQSAYRLQFGQQTASFQSLMTDAADVTRPILRGLRQEWNRGRALSYLEFHSNGLIDFGSKVTLDHQKLFVSWILADVINTLRAAAFFRDQAGMHDLEYGLEWRVCGTPSKLPIDVWITDRHYGGSEIGTLQDLPLLFPRLSFGPLHEVDKLANIIFGDLCDASGARYAHVTELKVSRESQWWLSATRPN